MDAYCKAIRKLEGKFYGIEYSHVVWDKNQAAVALSKLGSSRAKVPPGVFAQDLVKPSVLEEENKNKNKLEKEADFQIAQLNSYCNNNG